MEFRMGKDIEEEERQEDGFYKKDDREIFEAPDPNIIVKGGPNIDLEDYWNTIAKSLIWKSGARKSKIEKIYGKKEEE